MEPTDDREIKIPDKLYFKIGEVAKIIGVESYVLRYWETEFPQLKPIKSAANQRLYKRQDVELIVKIRELLYKHKYTIDGARKKIKDNKKDKKSDNSDEKQLPMFSDDSEVPSAKFNRNSSSGLVEEVIAEMNAYLKK